MAIEQRFEIGTKYKTRGKAPRVCTVVDVLRTYNSKDELVKLCYVSEYEFCGQIMTDWDVAEASVALGEIK